jgi:hypothetical protein
MRALTVAPSVANSARVEDIPDPLSACAVRLALGVCATDREILFGVHGWAPPGARRLVIGHESLGRVSKFSGVAAPGRALSIDLGRHNEDAVAVPQQASRGWLGRFIIRRVPAEQRTQALAPQPHDVKVAVDFS